MFDWLIDLRDATKHIYGPPMELLILWIAFYYAVRLFRSTRAASILWGLVVCMGVLAILIVGLDLTVLKWISGTIIIPTLAVSLVVIFQPELRMALAKLGTQRQITIFGFNFFRKHSDSDFVGDLVFTVEALSLRRHGALFAIERMNKLQSAAETGTRLDALFSKELALTIFFPKTTLHDGGVIIQNERIYAAACVFPVSSKELKDRSIGLRHRAAVGLTEESDAVVVIVSEETGTISLSIGGKLERNISLSYLKTRLNELLNYHEPNHEIQKTDNGKLAS